MAGCSLEGRSGWSSVISSQNPSAGSQRSESGCQPVCLSHPRGMMTQRTLGAGMCLALGVGQPGTLASLVKVTWARSVPLSTSDIIKVKCREDTNGRKMGKRTGWV